MNTIAEICAGIGLFFIGINALSSSLRHSSSHWFTEKIKKISGNSLYSCAFGLALGILTQSSSAATFIMINMVTAGISSVQAVLPVLVFSSIGTSFLVFIGAFNISMAVFFLLGFVGICYYLKWDSKPAIRVCLDICFGICMLMLGLHFIESNAEHVSSAPFILEFLNFAASSVLLSIIIGVFLTLILQSSAAVTLLVATFTLSGVFTTEQGILLIAGSSLGSGINIFLLAASSKGYSKQIAFLQLALKALGVAGILSLYFADKLLNINLLTGSLSFFSQRIEMQFAFFYLLMQLAGGLGILLLSKPLSLLAAKKFPPSIEERFSEPKYISTYVDENTKSSIDLAFQEQTHLIQLLSTCLSRTQDSRVNIKEIEGLLTACENIHDRTDQFLQGISHHCTDNEFAHQIANARHCNEIFGNIMEALPAYICAMLDNLEQEELEQAIVPGFNSMTDELQQLLATLSDMVSARNLLPNQQQITLLTAQPLMMYNILKYIDKSNRSLVAHVYSTVNAYNRIRYAISHYANAMSLLQNSNNPCLV